MRWWSVLLLVLAIVLVGGAALMVVLDAPVAAPASAALRFPWTMLSAEASTMNECVECHEPDVFHTCETCHDEHGSAALLNVPFDDLIMLSGDFPEPGYVAVNEILPYRDQPGTYVGLLEFLAERGVGDFQTVTLTSRDEGFVTLYRDNLTAGAMLLPSMSDSDCVAKMTDAFFLRSVFSHSRSWPAKPSSSSASQPSSMMSSVGRPSSRSPMR